MGMVRSSSLLGRVAVAAGTIAVCLAQVQTGTAEGSRPGGHQLWARRYNGPGNGDDTAYSLAVSPDGKTVFVTGGGGGPDWTSQDYQTVAYDSETGRKRWVSRYNGPWDGSDMARSLGVSPDGRIVFVTGSSARVQVHARNRSDIATLAYDARTGEELWVSRYNGPANCQDGAYRLAVSPDGRLVFVTGVSDGGTTCNNYDYVTVAYAAATGARLWARRYDDPDQGTDFAISVAVGPDGKRVFVTGFSYGGPAHDQDFETIAYSAITGSMVWKNRYHGPGGNLDEPAWPEPIAVSPDGKSVFVTGNSYTGTSTRGDLTTVAYDAATGAKRWVNRYNASPANLDDSPSSLRVSPDGQRLFVTGWFDGSSAGLFTLTVAYNANTGRRLWAKTYDGPGDPPYDDATVAHSLAVTPDGSSVFVSGYTGDDDYKTGDYSTVAYDAATGSRLWTKQYEGPGDGFDEAVSIAVSPDGTRLFVTGDSQGATSGVDYATLAYSTG